VCCSVLRVLQCMCASVLTRVSFQRCAAVCCSASVRLCRHASVFRGVLQCVAVCCSVLQNDIQSFSIVGAAKLCGVRSHSQKSYVCCSLLQCVAVCCSGNRKFHTFECINSHVPSHTRISADTSVGRYMRVLCRVSRVVGCYFGRRGFVGCV